MKIYSYFVTLELGDQLWNSSWKVHATDTSLRGIMQSMYHLYQKYVADHKGEEPLGDGIGLRR